MKRPSVTTTEIAEALRAHDAEHPPITQTDITILGDGEAARSLLFVDEDREADAAWAVLAEGEKVAVAGPGVGAEQVAALVDQKKWMVLAMRGDEAGDRRADDLARELRSLGVSDDRMVRLRPEVEGVAGAGVADLIAAAKSEGRDPLVELREAIQAAPGIISMNAPDPAVPASETDARDQAEVDPAVLVVDGDRDQVVDHHQDGDHDPAEAALGAWSKPVPLAGGPRPAFPLAALPPVVRNEVGALAEAVQVPVDLAAAVALGVLSAAVGDVSVEVRPGWLEPIAVYVVAVAESGEGKGPTVRALAAPLEAFDRERLAQERESVRIGQERHDTVVQRLQQARNAAAKLGAGPAEEALRDELAAELSNMKRPEPHRLLADDVTPEALVSLLAFHGRIAVISDEGGLFDTLAGRYSDGVANLDAVLKAWGRDAIRVDRKGRPSEHVQRPVLTLSLAVQPVVVERLAADPLLRGRGLPARFLFFWPHTRLGRRRDDSAPIPPAVTKAWDVLVRQLVSMPTQPTQPTQLGSGGNCVGCVGSVGGVSLTIDAAASQVFRAFKRAIEDRLRPEDDDLYAANGWAGKLPGQVVRVAGLLHLAEHGAAGLERPIGVETMRAACAIGLYLVDHALAAFGLDGPGGPLAPDARRLVAWIIQGDRREFSHREAHYALRSKARPASADWQPLLDLLERLGYIRRQQLDAATPRAGRPASPVYEVNPVLLAGEVGGS